MKTVTVSGVAFTLTDAQRCCLARLRAGDGPDRLLATAPFTRRRLLDMDLIEPCTADGAAADGIPKRGVAKHYRLTEAGRAVAAGL
jgi:hypothetical protein